MRFRASLKRIQGLQVECREVVQPPCPPAQIELLKGRMRESLGCELPGPYEEFLLLSNGLDWNGMTLYSAGYDLMSGQEYLPLYDVVYATQIHREPGGLERELVIGDSGTDLYIHDLDDGHAAMIDRVGHHEYETFASVEELLVEALRKSLQIFDD